MPYSNKQMLRDANGDLIPQYWDVVEQEFKPLTGRDGANDVRLTGSIVERVMVVERGIYSNNIFKKIKVPHATSAKMLFVEYRIHGVVGNLPNLNIRTESSSLSGPYQLYQLINNGIDSNGEYRHLWGVPVTDSAYKGSSATNEFSEVLPISADNNYEIRLYISGEFDEGEGYDLQVFAMSDGGVVVVD